MAEELDPIGSLEQEVAELREAAKGAKKAHVRRDLEALALERQKRLAAAKAAKAAEEKRKERVPLSRMARRGF